MITVLFHVNVRQGFEERIGDLLREMTRATREKDEGCLAYVFHRQKDTPGQYVLYEQWRDRQALDAHIAHMVSLLGAPPAGQMLPARLNEMCENARIVFYDVVA